MPSTSKHINTDINKSSKTSPKSYAGLKAREYLEALDAAAEPVSPGHYVIVDKVQGIITFGKNTVNGQVPHRALGPAIIKADGTRFYYLDGVLTRINGPAIIYGTGAGHGRIYYYLGVIHRYLDPTLPAVEIGKYKAWYHFGKLHRGDDLPAVMGIGFRSWWCMGFRHRPVGPGEIRDDGTQVYYLDGVITRKGLPAYMSPRSIMYFEGGLLHNSVGPAVILADGRSYWYTHGRRCEISPPGESAGDEADDTIEDLGDTDDTESYDSDPESMFWD